MIRLVTFCIVQATDKNSCMVVEALGIIIQALSSEVHWLIQSHLEVPIITYSDMH